MDEERDEKLPAIETRPRHRRSFWGAILLATLGLLYVAFLFTRDAGFLREGLF